MNAFLRSPFGSLQAFDGFVQYKVSGHSFLSSSAIGTLTHEHMKIRIPKSFPLDSPLRTGGMREEEPPRTIEPVREARNL